MLSNASYNRPLRIGIMAELTGACNLEPLVDSACKRLETDGHEPLVVASGNTTRSEMQAWDVLARSDCHGIILHSDTLSNDQLARMKGSRPNVVLSHIDHFKAGQLAADLLLQTGHKNIAMVASPSHRFSSQFRSCGFINQLKANPNNDIRNQVLDAESTDIGAGCDAMQTLLASKEPPTAVFFHHENLAAGGTTICKANNIRVPEDISILSCCQLHVPAHATQTVCTIRQPLIEIGEFAARRVVDLVQVKQQAYMCQTRWPEPFVDLRSTLHDRRAAMQSKPCKLSSRERECLEWASKGKTSWEISQILSLSESTVIYHLRNATRKLNAANRLHAVTKALKASLIQF